MTGGRGTRHLYVHLPFCSHRCGYCDFVTVVGDDSQHGTYVDALLAELENERSGLEAPLASIFVGGGTPTLTKADDLARLLDALPVAAEITIEANPETVTPDLAALLHDHRVTRVSLGVQSFEPRLLNVLERRGDACQAIRAFQALRSVGFDNLSLDLIYGTPGQTRDDLSSDLERALVLDPDHVSCYELEAKPGTRFTEIHGGDLSRQADAMETYFEDAVAAMEAAGYRWYETANFCRRAGVRSGNDSRDLRAQHNLAVWQGSDYIGIGVGAVSTRALCRTRNTASLRRYLEAHAAGQPTPRTVEVLTPAERGSELLMLGLRLDEGAELATTGVAIDPAGSERMFERGLVDATETRLWLTRRGRFLANAVTVELLVASEHTALAATL